MPENRETRSAGIRWNRGLARRGWLVSIVWLVAGCGAPDLGGSGAVATPEDAVRQYVKAQFLEKGETLGEVEWFEHRACKSDITVTRSAVDFRGEAVRESKETELVIPKGTLALRFQFKPLTDSTRPDASFSAFTVAKEKRRADPLFRKTPHGSEDSKSLAPYMGDGIFYLARESFGYRCIHHTPVIEGGGMEWDAALEPVKQDP